MLSERMMTKVDEAMAAYRARIIKEFEKIDALVDAKLEGRGEFSMADIEAGEGEMLKANKEMVDEIIAKGEYEEIEVKALKKKEKKRRNGARK
jgi:hypothetical protein